MNLTGERIGLRKDRDGWKGLPNHPAYSLVARQRIAPLAGRVASEHVGLWILLPRQLLEEKLSQDN